MNAEKMLKYLTENKKRFWYLLIPGGVLFLAGLLISELRALRVLWSLGRPLMLAGIVYVIILYFLKLKGKDVLEFTGDQMTAESKSIREKIENEIEAYHKEVFKKEHRESGPFEKLYAEQYLASDEILTRRVNDLTFASDRGEVCGLWKERKGKVLRVFKTSFRFTTEEVAREDYYVSFSQITDLNWEEYHYEKNGIKCKQLHVTATLAGQPVALTFPADYDSEDFFKNLKEEIAKEI